MIAHLILATALMGQGELKELPPVHKENTKTKRRCDEELLRQLRIMNEFMDRLNELVKFQVLPIRQEKTTPISKY